MNLIEARKAAHEEWVRSASRTDGEWVQLEGSVIVYTNFGRAPQINTYDLDATDWEPKPKPIEPFEAEVWLDKGGSLFPVEPNDNTQRLLGVGWRRIRVREVVE